MPLLSCCFYYALIYFDALAEPNRLIIPFFTIEPRVASTVVGLTWGKYRQISAFDNGFKLFNTIASMRAFFVSL